MDNKKRDHTNKGRSILRWATKIFIICMASLIVMFSLCLFWITYIVFTDGALGWGLLLFLASLVTFTLAVLFLRWAIYIPRIDHGMELREEGIYQFFIDYGRQETTERFVAYSQIERIYLGRYSVKIHNQPYHFIGVRIVLEWTENEKKTYTSIIVDNQEQLERELKRFSKNIPINTTVYDLHNIPDGAMSIIFSSSGLTELKERDPLILPFPAFKTQFSSGPQWEPTEKREKRKNRYEKLDKYGMIFFRLSLIYCFLYSLFFIPNWHISDDFFDDQMMIIFPIPLLLPLIIFFYLRKKINIKQTIKQVMYLLAVYLLGTFGGLLFKGLGLTFFIAVLHYGTMFFLSVVAIFIVVKMIWWFCFGLIVLFQVAFTVNSKIKHGSIKGSNKPLKVKSN
jgi:hypothetical protein